MQIEIGTPVFSPSDRLGFVSRVMAPDSNSYLITGAGLIGEGSRLEIVYDDGLDVVGDALARPWIDRARAMQIAPIDADELAKRRERALEARTARQQAAQDSRAAEVVARAAFIEEAKVKTPTWAKAVIVGELVEDRSDVMTDYFGGTTVRTVILAFSSHTRDLFPEIRKAALNFEGTADLFDAPESAEHREKYSMGAGFYLKRGSRYSNGWKVSKKRIWDGVQSIPQGEWFLTAAPAPDIATAPDDGGQITRHVHTKHGFDMWIVSLAERVEREEFDRLNAAAKAVRGWYSRKWGTSPAGFAFKSEEAAKTFAAEHVGAVESNTSAPAVERAPAPGVGEKLRGLAEKMQGEIDHKFADRLTNTPKRQREAGSARIDGYRLQRTQQALRALADHHDAGTVPAALRGVTTKAAVFDLARSHVEHNGSYYHAGHDTGRPALETPAAVALWAMIKGPSLEERQAADLKDKIQALQFANIPGYFPTPGPVVARMIEEANIPDGARVLEPSAGSGAILDGIKATTPNCELLAFERHLSLRAILTAKGYTLTGDDFTESDPALKVDRVLMNPPFENGQDALHVMRAFDHLKPGGRLVAIMSPGPFFRSDAKAQVFRAWFDAKGGEKTDLPAGSFKESGTGVATVLVVVDA